MSERELRELEAAFERKRALSEVYSRNREEADRVLRLAREYRSLQESVRKMREDPKWD